MHPIETRNHEYIFRPLFRADPDSNIPVLEECDKDKPCHLHDHFWKPRPGEASRGLVRMSLERRE